MDGVPAISKRQAWAISPFAAADLGDQRRTRRLVKLATQMAGNSCGSIPQQTGAAADMKAAYRLFDADDVTHAAVCAPHFAYTRRLASQQSPNQSAAQVGHTDGQKPPASDPWRLIFLIQDTCDLNFTTHPHCVGLGPIGHGGMQGLHQQNILAVDPLARRPLGLMYQQHHRWTQRPKSHSRQNKRNVPLEERASNWWIEGIRAVGRPPPAHADPTG